MEKIKIIRLDGVDSTNSYLRHYDGEEGSLMTVVTAEWQTAGRGQGGTSWESEAGKNLTLSVKTRPRGLAAARQFALLEAMALATRDALSAYAGDMRVKWPNDVYWRDMKISGTLSECAVSGGLITSCVSGIGVNVNQRVFRSDAPNPVSLRSILGRDVDREEVLSLLTSNIERYLRMVNDGLYDDIDKMYGEALYRREGSHGYRDAEGEFMAELERVEPDGHLRLRRADGRVSRYAFKEVSFVLPDRQ